MTLVILKPASASKVRYSASDRSAPPINSISRSSNFPKEGLLPGGMTISMTKSLAFPDITCRGREAGHGFIKQPGGLGVALSLPDIGENRRLKPAIFAAFFAFLSLFVGAEAARIDTASTTSINRKKLNRLLASITISGDIFTVCG
jgi:hypothetical protein